MKTPVIIIILLCVTIYLIILIKILFKGFNSDSIIRISAPSSQSIEKEKKDLLNSFSYPDILFEKMVALILNDDPNPRKVLKLIDKYFSKEDEETLLQCLSINNNKLYNEIINLINCNTDSYEEYETLEYPIDIEELRPADRDSFMQRGVPASFFLLASESIINPHPDIHMEISIAYESLNHEDQIQIIAKCENLRKKKKPLKANEEVSQIEEMSQIIEDGAIQAEIFMELFKNENQNN